MEIITIIICVTVALAMGAGAIYAAAGITILVGGDGGTFMLSLVGVVIALGFANKTACEWIDRRKSRKTA